MYFKRPRCGFFSPDEEDHIALAPFLDLLNHSTTANVSAVNFLKIWTHESVLLHKITVSNDINSRLLMKRKPCINIAIHVRMCC